MSCRRHPHKASSPHIVGQAPTSLLPSDWKNHMRESKSRPELGTGQNRVPSSWPCFTSSSPARPRFTPSSSAGHHFHSSLPSLPCSGIGSYLECMCVCALPPQQDESRKSVLNGQTATPNSVLLISADLKTKSEKHGMLNSL